ncbi:MAG: hypothetical protein ACK6CP_06345 [Pseudanabaena sp.]|nr:hypothetical protein [Pseudanabaena sp. M125S2SP2A07QC]MCA6539841.1 hypothetical protein [Pseudanabaena sp. M037S2SP2A07QC]MCA6545300.1 hypothetical protein [Pseudanabaena sp. M074S1SP2A07QC]MCA6555429.1 hypothetical protein [Pseudanabaena sp. M114S2SP2A07QC]
MPLNTQNLIANSLKPNSDRLSTPKPDRLNIKSNSDRPFTRTDFQYL